MKASIDSRHKRARTIPSSQQLDSLAAKHGEEAVCAMWSSHRLVHNIAQTAHSADDPAIGRHGDC